MYTTSPVSCHQTSSAHAVLAPGSVREVGEVVPLNVRLSWFPLHGSPSHWRHVGRVHLLHFLEPSRITIRRTQLRLISEDWSVIKTFMLFASKANSVLLPRSL